MLLRFAGFALTPLAIRHDCGHDAEPAADVVGRARHQETVEESPVPTRSPGQRPGRGLHPCATRSGAAKSPLMKPCCAARAGTGAERPRSGTARETSRTGPRTHHGAHAAATSPDPHGSRSLTRQSPTGPSATSDVCRRHSVHSSPSRYTARADTGRALRLSAARGPYGRNQRHPAQGGIPTGRPHSDPAPPH